MKKRFSSVFIFNVIISLLLWGAFLFFLPVTEKYSLELVEEYPISQRKMHFYEDLYNDGTSEDVWFINDYTGFPSMLLDDGGKVPFQWNMTGEFWDHFIKLGV